MLLRFPILIILVHIHIISLSPICNIKYAERGREYVSVMQWCGFGKKASSHKNLLLVPPIPTLRNRSKFVRMQLPT